MFFLFSLLLSFFIFWKSNFGMQSHQGDVNRLDSRFGFWSTILLLQHLCWRLHYRLSIFRWLQWWIQREEHKHQMQLSLFFKWKWIYIRFFQIFVFILFSFTWFDRSKTVSSIKWISYFRKININQISKWFLCIIGDSNCCHIPIDSHPFMIFGVSSGIFYIFYFFQPLYLVLILGKIKRMNSLKIDGERE